MDLDELLNRSAPGIAPRTPAVRQELVAMVAQSERSAPRRRRGLRAGVVSAALAGVVGLGSAASASGLLPFTDWLPWSASSGTTCQVAFDVRMADGDNGEAISPQVAAMTTEQKNDVVLAARNFLESFDLSTVDTDDAIAKWRAAEEQARSQASPEERQPKLVGDDLELTAVGREVSHRLVSHLKAHGLNPNAVVIAEGNRCGR